MIINPAKWSVKARNLIYNHRLKCKIRIQTIRTEMKSMMMKIMQKMSLIMNQVRWKQIRLILETPQKFSPSKLTQLMKSLDKAL